MILIITNKLDPHADSVISVLKNERVDFFRFNTEDFPQSSAITWGTAESGIDGIIRLSDDRQVHLSHISSCWYRRPNPPVVSKDLITKQAKEFAEDESNSFLKGLWVYLSNCFWINYPPTIYVAESKIYNLKLASNIGFSIPRTLITNNPQEAKKFIYECKNNVINKVLGKGQVEYLRDYYFVYTHKILSEDLNRMQSIIYSPVLLQEYIPKRIEIRVTIVGKKIFSCEIHSQDSKKTLDDWRHYDLENVRHTIHRLPQSIESLCLKMAEKLGLNFATIDLILTPDQNYVFLELNPNGQWLWIEQLTGLPISSAIAELLINGGQK